MNRCSYLRAGVLALGLLASTSASQAAASPPARWCLSGGYTYGECVYSTLEQCLQDRNGEGGYCQPNPSAPPRAH